MDRVTVTVPARLHLGFVDMHGGLGRKFGSLGLSIAEPVTRLTLSRAPGLVVAGPEARRATDHLQTMFRHLGFDARYKLEIEEAIPSHAGLGSGTQLGLAVAAAVRVMNGVELDPVADAARLGRGARSGVGIGLFAAGGFAMDGGRAAAGGPAPVIARLPFPEEWRVILILDPDFEGVHGEDERAAFARLPEFPEADAAHLCRLAVMKALPALADADITDFGDAIAEIQRRVGDHFAMAQGGRYASPKVAEAAAILARAGAHGVGQSSWGPTAFAFAESEDAARSLVKNVQQRQGLDIRVVRGNNHAARIEKHAKASVA